MVASGTDAFYRIINRVHGIAFRQRRDRDLDIGQARCLVAYLAKEMDVPLADGARLGVAPADLVLHRTAAVLERVDRVMLQEQGQRAEDGRAIQGLQFYL